MTTIEVEPVPPPGGIWGWIRRSPLTDPRALLLSLGVHVVVLLVASVAAFQVIGVIPADPPPATLVGDLGSTDNRAPAFESGGSAGEAGGEAADVSVDRAAPDQPTRDPAADELLGEILPRTPQTSDLVSPTLPGPSTSGVGLIPGAGSGGGGGSGGGNNPGTGQGSGPGTEFFGVRDRAGSYAYVIDCSGSMLARDSLEVAKRELLASLGRIPPDCRFGVVFYNINANVLSDPQGRQALMPATPASKERVKTLLQAIEPNGGTDHLLAIRAAVALKPEVIFFLTDADLIISQDVSQIRAMLGKIRLQVVEFGVTGVLGENSPLQKLARDTGGSYRYIDVRTFRK